MIFFVYLIIIIVSHLFKGIKSDYYVYLTVEKAGDCLKEVNYEGTNTLYTFNGGECDDDHKYNNPLFSKINYELGKKINFILHNSLKNAYLKITVYVNEYTIEINHKKFWVCENCKTSDGNCIYDIKKKRLKFCKVTGINFLKCSKSYNYNFYFQINNPSELEYEENIVNNDYYGFTEQKDFYITICNVENEIALINFNTTDNFYIKDNITLIPPYEDKGFKIIFLNSISGKFVGLDASKNDQELDIYYQMKKKPNMEFF